MSGCLLVLRIERRPAGAHGADAPPDYLFYGEEQIIHAQALPTGWDTTDPAVNETAQRLGFILG